MLTFCSFFSHHNVLCLVWTQTLQYYIKGSTVSSASSTCKGRGSRNMSNTGGSGRSRSCKVACSTCILQFMDGCCWYTKGDIHSSIQQNFQNKSKCIRHIAQPWKKEAFISLHVDSKHSCLAKHTPKRAREWAEAARVFSLSWSGSVFKAIWGSSEPSSTPQDWLDHNHHQLLFLLLPLLFLHSRAYFLHWSLEELFHQEFPPVFVVRTWSSVKWRFISSFLIGEKLKRNLKWGLKSMKRERERERERENIFSCSLA